MSDPKGQQEPSEAEDLGSELYRPDEPEEQSGLILGFWEAGIIGTLMIAFFPWSLLFCAFVFGMDYTKALVLALIHDAIKVAMAILAVLVFIVVLIAVIVALTQ